MTSRPGWPFRKRRLKRRLAPLVLGTKTTDGPSSAVILRSGSDLRFLFLGCFKSPPSPKRVRNPANQGVSTCGFASCLSRLTVAGETPYFLASWRKEPESLRRAFTCSSESLGGRPLRVASRASDMEGTNNPRCAPGGRSTSATRSGCVVQHHSFGVVP